METPRRERRQPFATGQSPAASRTAAAVLYDEIAAFARAEAGTALDLDGELEQAGIESSLHAVEQGIRAAIDLG